MTPDESINVLYNELKEVINLNYVDLYKTFDNEKLSQTLSTLHAELIGQYKMMNNLFPITEATENFSAGNSRRLLEIIDQITTLKDNLIESKYCFKLDPYYKDVINQSLSFLKPKYGSKIPHDTNKIIIYLTKPIFIKTNTLAFRMNNFELHNIGYGAFANVYSFTDPNYHCRFALKRAKPDISAKDLERFKQEFAKMSELSSPYILEVYSYNEEENEFIMEFADTSLRLYIQDDNPDIQTRIKITNQIFHGFKYLHSKGMLHRDIHPNNILIKKYDDVNVIKIADFGLVKIPDSNLTSVTSPVIGCCVDPSLSSDGFANYKMCHEIYALSMLVAYIFTGRETLTNIKNPHLKAFVERGTNTEKNKRFQSVDEMESEFSNIKKEL